jgi:hypothetical protein
MVNMKPVFCVVLVVMGSIGTSILAFAQSGWQKDGAMVRLSYAPDRTTYGDEYAGAQSDQIEAYVSLQKVPYLEESPLMYGDVSASYRQQFKWVGTGQVKPSFPVNLTGDQYTYTPGASAYAQKSSMGAAAKAKSWLKGGNGSLFSVDAIANGTLDGAYDTDPLTGSQITINASSTSPLTARIDSDVYARAEGTRLSTSGTLDANSFAGVRFMIPDN